MRLCSHRLQGKWRRNGNEKGTMGCGSGMGLSWWWWDVREREKGKRKTCFSAEYTQYTVYVYCFKDTAHVTQNWPEANSPGFTKKNQWTSNFPGLNPLDYHLSGTMLKKYHKLSQSPRLLMSWKSLCIPSGTSCRKNTIRWQTSSNAWLHAWSLQSPAVRSISKSVTSSQHQKTGSFSSYLNTGENNFQNAQN